MTRDEAVAEIKRQMAFRTTLDSTIVTQLQIAQTQLESGDPLPWFMKTTGTLTTTADTPVVSISSLTGFLRLQEDRPLVYIPDDDTEFEVDLKQDTLQNLRKNYRLSDGSVFDNGGFSTGEPEAYALEGDSLYVYPIPDASTYDILVPYYTADTSLSTNVENNWLKFFPFLLMGIAGKMIAGAIRDGAAVGIFSSWEQQGMANYTRRVTSRELGGRELQIGGPH